MSKALVLATAIDENGTTSALMQGRTSLGETTETALILHDPASLTYEQYEEIGRLLGTANRRLAWAIGDWLCAVEDIYPDRYSQAALATRLAPQTLANRASVCRHIPREERIAGLAFGVHAEVAYLPVPERRRWLKKAAAGDWTRADLRANMKGSDELPPVGETICSCCGQPMKEEE
jgi:hypothetical protein